jgi:Zn-dependent protease
MNRPIFLTPESEATQVGEVFGTPLKVVGNTWLPFTQLGVWGVMTWLAGKRKPGRSFWSSLGVGGLTTAVLLGSEWCHNLAHAAAAKLTGKPMDAMRIVWGMPLCVYYDLHDLEVAPRQHMLRALGGPIFNAAAMLLARLLRIFTPQDSVAREVADVAVGMNMFLWLQAIMPIPGLDGGPILKWALVEQGKTPPEADEFVRKANGVTAPLLATGSVLAFKKRKRLAGGLLGMFAVLSAVIFLGWLKEE